jgi:hypothetical protein
MQRKSEMNRTVLRLPRETPRLVLWRPLPEFAEGVQQAIEETFEGLHLWMPWAKELQSLEETVTFLDRADRRFMEGEDFVVSAFSKKPAISC